MLFGNEIDAQSVHDFEGVSASRTTYGNCFIYSTEKD